MMKERRRRERNDDPGTATAPLRPSALQAEERWAALKLITQPVPRQNIVGRRYWTPPEGTSTYSWQTPSGRRTLVTLRMALSVFGELGNVGTNVIDHAVRAVERASFRQKYLPNRLRHYTGQKRLAILFHGYAQGRAAFETMERVLSSDLFGIFPVAAGYQPYSQDIRLSAEQERERIEWILSRTDAEELILIGHSQGGLVIRDLVQRQRFTERLKHCIFLATPHMGTWAAVLGNAHRAATATLGRVSKRFTVEGESARQMVPGSEFLKALNSRPLPPGIHYTNVYNFLDPLVWPARFARLPYSEAHNVLMMKIGHLQTLYDLQELEIILRCLMATNLEQADFSASIVGDQSMLETREIELVDGGTEGETYEEVVAGGS